MQGYNPNAVSDDEFDAYLEKLIDDSLNQSPEVFNKQIEYSNLMDQYLERFDKNVYDDYSDVVGTEFEISDDLDKKIQILKDALSRKITLEESEYYAGIQEGVIFEDDHFFK